MGIKTGKRMNSENKLTIISNKRLKKLYITYIFWSKYLPVSMCIKSGTYFFIIVTISDFWEFGLLNTLSKSALTSSNNILMTFVLLCLLGHYGSDCKKSGQA